MEELLSIPAQSSAVNTMFDINTNDHTIQFNHSKRGIDIHIPPAHCLWRSVCYVLRHNVDLICAATYPIPLSAVLTAAFSSCLYAYYYNNEALRTSHKIMNGALFLYSLNPLTHFIPARFTWTVLCGEAWTSALFALTVLHRFLLRRLLRYQKWLNEGYVSSTLNKIVSNTNNSRTSTDIAHSTGDGTATVSIHNRLYNKNTNISCFNYGGDDDYYYSGNKSSMYKWSWRTRIWSSLLKWFHTHHRVRHTDLFENCLPTLPIPTLSRTVEKYLASMQCVYRPRNDLTDWMELRRAAESFLLNDGPLLHRHLLKQSASRRNYVVDWWIRYVMLADRHGLGIHSNYYLSPYAFYTPTHLPEARAGVLLYHMLQYKRSLERQTCLPDYAGPRNAVPLSMSAALNMFNTTRIPGRECDVLEHNNSPFNNSNIANSSAHCNCINEGVGYEAESSMLNQGGINGGGSVHNSHYYYHYDFREGNHGSIIHRLLGRNDDNSNSNSSIKRFQWCERHGEYVVVFYKGKIYQVELVHPFTHKPLTPHELEITLHDLLHHDDNSIKKEHTTTSEEHLYPSSVVSSNESEQEETTSRDESAAEDDFEFNDNDTNKNNNEETPEKNIHTPTFTRTPMKEVSSPPSAATAARLLAARYHSRHKRRSFRRAEEQLPVLTFAPRAQWADIRNTYFINDVNNRLPLRIIERAMCVVSFEPCESNAHLPFIQSYRTEMYNDTEGMQSSNTLLPPPALSKKNNETTNENEEEKEGEEKTNATKSANNEENVFRKMHEYEAVSSPLEGTPYNTPSVERVHEECAMYMCGSIHCPLWLDKSFNMIVTNNGRVGFNVESSWANKDLAQSLLSKIMNAERENASYDDDGHARLLRHELHTSQRYKGHKSHHDNTNRLPQPRQIRFTMHKQLAHCIHTAYENYLSSVVSQFDVNVIRFSGYGQQHMYACGCEPSSWMEMALQLAHYIDDKCNTELSSTTTPTTTNNMGSLHQHYQIVSQRSFAKGREESVRSMYDETAAFIYAMWRHYIKYKQAHKEVYVTEQTPNNDLALNTTIPISNSNNSDKNMNDMPSEPNEEEKHESGEHSLPDENKVTNLTQGSSLELNTARPSMDSYVNDESDESEMNLFAASELLRHACACHERRIHEAQSGNGVDQHLTALYMMSAAEQHPSDFLNLYLRRTKWRFLSIHLNNNNNNVSSSNSSSRSISYSNTNNSDNNSINDEVYETYAGGIGPKVKDGYGVTYCFNGANTIYVTITTRKDGEIVSSERFGKHLIEALELMG